jgi:hypothetical protein
MEKGRQLLTRQEDAMIAFQIAAALLFSCSSCVLALMVYTKPIRTMQHMAIQSRLLRTMTGHTL